MKTSVKKAEAVKAVKVQGVEKATSEEQQRYETSSKTTGSDLDWN